MLCSDQSGTTPLLGWIYGSDACRLWLANATGLLLPSSSWNTTDPSCSYLQNEWPGKVSIQQHRCVHKHILQFPESRHTGFIPVAFQRVNPQPLLHTLYHTSNKTLFLPSPVPPQELGYSHLLDSGCEQSAPSQGTQRFLYPVEWESIFRGTSI